MSKLNIKIKQQQLKYFKLNAIWNISSFRIIKLIKLKNKLEINLNFFELINKFKLEYILRSSTKYVEN